MLNRSVVVAFALFASLGIAACGGTTAASGESAKDPWSDFSGKYSTPGEGSKTADKSADEPGAKKTDDKKGDSKAKADATKNSDEAALPPAPISKKTAKGTVKGESISSVSVDTLTDATKSLKAKFVSNSVVTGPQYELVQVQLKGATIQITRPASTPQPQGPAVASPSTKKGELSKTDASFYDEDADVLFVVSGGKKAASQKTLNALLKK